jgi:hypothetical protein
VLSVGTFCSTFAGWTIQFLCIVGIDAACSCGPRRRSQFVILEAGCAEVNSNQIEPPYSGNVLFTQHELNAWVERMHRAGIQVNCHANGTLPST